MCERTQERTDMKWLRRTFGGGRKQKTANKKNKRAFAGTDRQQDAHVMATLHSMPEKEVNTFPDFLSTAGSSGVQVPQHSQQCQVPKELQDVLQKLTADNVANLRHHFQERIKSFDEKLSGHIKELKTFRDQVEALSVQLKVISETQQRMQESPNIQESQCLPVPSDSGFEPGISVSPHCPFGNVRSVVSETPDSDSCQLALDPNTAHKQLHLSEGNRVVTRKSEPQSYPDHQERFNCYHQVLCTEGLTGCCYWEVEWTGYLVCVAVTYKGISRKGWGDDSWLGGNDKSWCLICDPCSYDFWHNKERTKVSGPHSSRIGVYLDHRAGTLSFYSISDTMSLLHRVQTTFTEPLYPAFKVYETGSTVKLC